MPLASNLNIIMMITLAYQHVHWQVIPAGTCPEPVFPYIPYLLTYPSGSSPALSSRRKNTGVNLRLK